MKKATLFALPFLFLIALALSVGAEPTTQSTDLETTATVADAAEVEQVEASLEWPLRPGFLVSQSLGSCEACTSHNQCRGFCGGYGACLKDVQTVCGTDPYARFCFC